MVTSIVLAGGRSRRLGRDKRLELVGGIPLLQRVIDTLAPLSSEILLVVHTDTSLQQLGLSAPSASRVRTVTDLYAEGSQLMGLYSGLMESLTPYSFAVGADMPFLNSHLIRHMADQAAGFDAMVPRIAGRLEPLHAVYSQGCIPPLRAAIQQQRLGLADLLRRSGNEGVLKVKHIEEREVSLFDPHHLSFFNINTEEDLARARRISSELESRASP